MLSKFGAIGRRPCQSAVNTTRKPSRGLATLLVKIWYDRAVSLSTCCSTVETTRKPSRGLVTFRAIGLRPCQCAVNTTRKPSRGLATLRVKIWGDRAATLSKCCKYHTKTEQGFSHFACKYLVRSGCDLAVNTTRKPRRG